MEGGSGGGEVVVRMREGIQGRSGTRVLRWDLLSSDDDDDDVDEDADKGWNPGTEWNPSS